MTCLLCQHGSMVRVARGPELWSCPNCRATWEPEVEFRGEALERLFVAAHSVSPTACPGCAAQALRLGAIGHRAIHRCSACGGAFVLNRRVGLPEVAGATVIDPTGGLLFGLAVGLGALVRRVWPTLWRRR